MGRGRHYQPHVIASARNDYENSDDSLPTIVARSGVPARTLQRWAVEDGWKRRSERPLRDLPEATRLLDAVTALEAQAAAADPPPPDSVRNARSKSGAGPEARAHDGAQASTGDRPHHASFEAASTVVEAAPQDDGVTGGNSAPSVESKAATPSRALLTGIESAERQVNAQLAIEESRARKRGGAPPTRTQAAATARTLATLTQTLQKLAALRRGDTVSGEIDHDEFPADIDEFRCDLARRIDAFVTSRLDAGNADGNSRPAPVDEAR